MCRNVAYLSSVFVSINGGTFLSLWVSRIISFVDFSLSFHFKFYQISGIVEFQELKGILEHFVSWFSFISRITVMILMVNVPCMFRRLPISFLSRPAKRRLRTGSAAAATRPRSLGCECQSALMPASRLQSLHAGERRANGHSAEPPVRPAVPARGPGWTLARGTQQKMQRLHLQQM